ncbi:MAG TPA: hypothetical protein VES20_08505 [Bryobacteraceae bacterium]|nr:hypothetical protein [Bryobacteraceae bacterium]
MTKVQIEYKLVGPLSDAMLDRIARAHGIYGIDHVKLSPAGDRVIIQYDASRLSAKEVEKTMHDIGLAVALDA